MVKLHCVLLLTSLLHEAKFMPKTQNKRSTSMHCLVADCVGAVQVKKDFQEAVLSYRQDDFFRKNMYANFGDIGSAVKELVDEFQKQTSNSKRINTIEDMQASCLATQQHATKQAISSSAACQTRTTAGHAVMSVVMLCAPPLPEVCARHSIKSRIGLLSKSK